MTWFRKAPSPPSKEQEDAARAEQRFLIQTILKVELLSKLPLGEVESLLDLLKKRTYRRGRTVIRQGRYGDTFYMIASGTASIWKRQSWFRRTHAGRLGPGDFFGETALIERTRRSATIIAESPLVVYTLSGASFADHLLAHPTTRQRLETEMAKRKKGPRSALIET